MNIKVAQVGDYRFVKIDDLLDYIDAAELMGNDPRIILSYLVDGLKYALVAENPNESLS